MNNPVQLNAEYSTAIVGKGLWPVLKKLPDGSLGVFIYNKPSHGFGCGNIELYISEDSGKSWSFRSQVSEHQSEPEHVRMNHAVGINSDGQIVAIISGWSEGREAPILKPQICISSDNGISWERTILNFDSDFDFVPYGDIVLDDQKHLTAAFYSRNSSSEAPNFYISRSLDGGNKWEPPEYAMKASGEVTVLKTKDNKWFAVGRDVSRLTTYCNQKCAADPLLLFASEDGQNWQQKSVLTLPGQIPGHILELRDGRLLVTYGCRIIGLCGVQAIISSDSRESWSTPAVLLGYNGSLDCGYPSTIELEDGTLLTAFYAESIPEGSGVTDLPSHSKYLMGTLRWTTDVFEKGNEIEEL
jgi:hypothetical protein